MQGPGSNPYNSNRHADVMNEEPTDDAGKLRLVEEVKNRAKGAFSQKDMPSAELLYGKAISLLNTLPGKAEPALYSNRAMVRLNLAKVEDALEDANKCISVDPTFFKAYHRKGQALLRLGQFDEAVAAAEEGVKIKPDNKELQDLIVKARKEQEKEAEDKANLKRDAQDVRVELHNASTARAANNVPPIKKEKKDGEDEDNSMRGYKKTADGKTTSYFHTEITEEAKRLLAEQGSGKPKKLEAPTEEQQAQGGGSQWNQAGTYEEKGMMKWIEERLKAKVIGLSFQIPTGQGGAISTTAVADIKGDASISVSRGKRRHLLDLSFAVEFDAKVGESAGKGKLCFSEVSTDDDDGFEVKMDINLDTPPGVREVCDAFAKSAGQGLQPLVLKAVRAVIEDYKAE